MADHVTVDPQTLGRMADELGRAEAALRSADDPTGREVGVLGHPGLVGAMEEFTGNWRVHRRALLETLDAHQKMLRSARDGYQTLDRALADAVTPDAAAQSGAPGAPR